MKKSKEYPIQMQVKQAMMLWDVYTTALQSNECQCSSLASHPDICQPSGFYKERYTFIFIENTEIEQVVVTGGGFMRSVLVSMCEIKTHLFEYWCKHNAISDMII